MLTQAKLLELFQYDEASGALIWKIDKGRAIAGTTVTTLDGKGYRQVGVDGKKYRVHRVIWMMKTGNWPSTQIDHRDRVKTNNAWGNLLPKTAVENKHNTGAHRDNTSGYVGVTWSAHRKKWVAQLAVNGKNLNLGGFSSALEAATAYQAAKRIHHPSASL